MASDQRERLKVALDDLRAFAEEHDGAMETGAPGDNLRDDALELFHSEGLDRETLESLAEVDIKVGRPESRDDADLETVVAISRSSFIMGLLTGWKARGEEVDDA
jgi:hypothetical protein